MDNKLDLKTFPSNRFEALAMLFVEKNFTKDMSPTTLVDMYVQVLSDIQNHYSET